MEPVPPIVPLEAPRPAKPELFARIAREKAAPRVAAVLFWSGEDASHPLLVLENGALQWWNVPGEALHVLAPCQKFRRPDETTCAVFSPECEVIATSHHSGQVRLQRLERAARAAPKCHAPETLEAHRGRVLSLALSLAAAQTRLYSAGADGAVVLTELCGVSNPDPASRGSASRDSRVILDGLGALSALAVSPDGGWMALGADDGQVQMWQLSQAGTLLRLDWTSGKDLSAVKSLGFAPNGNMLLSRNARGAACLWAARTGHRLQPIAPPHPLLCAAFAGDSRLLGHAGAAGDVTLRDAWTGEIRHTLPPIAGEVQTLSFLPPSETSDGQTLLIVAGSQQILAWKVSF